MDAGKGAMLQGHYSVAAAPSSRIATDSERIWHGKPLVPTNLHGWNMALGLQSELTASISKWGFRTFQGAL